MKNIKIYICFIGLLLFNACKQEDIASIETNTAVVTAYLYAGQPLDSLRITQSYSYGSEDTTLVTLDDLSVYVNTESSTFLLEKKGEGYYQNESLIIEEDQTYYLEFEHKGEMVEAETYIPTKKEVEISDSQVFLQKIEGFPVGGFTQPEPIELSWDNSEGDYYYVFIENLEENPEYVNELLVQFGDQIRRFRMRTEPDIIDFYSINPMRTLTQYGTYRIIVFRVQPEYASLYTLGNTSSQTISEPPSNVKNGLGLFTGLSSDTLYLEVKKP